MRILTILGTRPEIVKLVPVLLTLRNRPGVDSRLCHTGQHDTLGLDLLKMVGIAPVHQLARAESRGLPLLFNHLLNGAGKAIDAERPDIVIVQGDTASAAAGAMAAFHRRIPVAHVEAGLRSGDLSQPWPEEGYRRMIAPLARWHFAPTAGAAANLIAEGINPGHVFRTGNTVIDALAMAQEMLRSNPDFGSGAEALLNRFAGKPFALATVHRREHDGDDLRGIGMALRTLGERIGIILPAHPRPESRVLLEVIGDHPAIAVVPPLDYLPFLRVLDRSRLVLTDSGGVQEEATALGRPVLVLRSVTERAEAITAGTARLVGSNPAAILRAAEEVLAEDHSPQPDDVFGDGQAARRIVDVLTA